MRDRIRTNFESFFTGDLDGAVAVMAPDIVAIDAPEMPDAGVHNGRTELKERLAGFRDLFDRFELERYDIHELGDLALVVLQVSAQARAAEVPVHFELAYLLELRDDYIATIRVFFAESQAREYAAQN